MNCLLCNRRISATFSWHQLLRWGPLHDAVVCNHCWEQFIPYEAPHCEGCGRTADNGQLCQECQQWEQQVGWHLHHQCLFQYNDAMKGFMHRYKFQGDYRLWRVFSEVVTRQLNHYQADIITTVPVSQQTWLTRGFNQVNGMVEQPTEELLTVIERDKRPQSTRSRRERLAVPQPFCWQNEQARLQVRGQQVILVDDVYTTGRTMYHAAALFREAGVKSVKTFSLAG